MKNILFILAFLITTLAFSQSSSVKGSLFDIENNNEPLMFAKISIKETGAKTHTDDNGLFEFNNLEEGSYTLVYSFVGYETKEESIKVLSGKANTIKATLKASSISIEEIMHTLASNEAASTPMTTNN